MHGSIRRRAIERIESVRFEGVAIDSTARPPRAQDRAEAERLLAAQVQAGTVKLHGWDETVEQWIARVRCVAQWFPERGLLTYTPDDIAVIQMTAKEPTANSKGLRLGSFDQIRGIIDEELEAVWAGDKTAQAAMDSAKERGDVLLRRFERANR